MIRTCIATTLWGVLPLDDASVPGEPGLMMLWFVFSVGEYFKPAARPFEVAVLELAVVVFVEANAVLA